MSIGGGTGAVWSTDGTTICCRAEGGLMAVDVHTGASVRVGRPRELFADEGYFEVTGGGGLDELKQLVPAGR